MKRKFIFTLTILFTLFFFVHIIQVAIAGWNNFRSMVIGFEVIPPGQTDVAEKIEESVNLPSNNNKIEKNTK